MRAARSVYVDGRLVAAHRARLDVFDRGLLYGDGLLETLRCYAGEPFALDRHLARLRESAAFLEIPVPRIAWRRVIDAVLRRNRLTQLDAWVRITLTRGAGARGLTPPRRPVPTLVVAAGSIDPAIAAQQRRGVRLMPVALRRDPFFAAHKTLSYLPGIVARNVAARTGADDALFVDRGRVLETPTANLFAFHGEELWTPRSGVLRGVTRGLVIEIAAGRGLRVRERSLRLEELEGADEAFLTSSLTEVVPVIAVAGARIGKGEPGQRTRALQRAYAALRLSGSIDKKSSLL